MNQWKSNKRLWYALALALLLCAASLVTSTGTAYARYRTEEKKTVTYEVRQKGIIGLGTITTDGSTETFTSVSDLSWDTVGDASTMTFAVSNGTATEYSALNQQFSVRILGSLGVWTGDSTVNLSLQLPDSEETLQAKVTAIQTDTPLYHTHGPGWIYTFQDSDNEELTWTLPGDAFSYVTLTITRKGAGAESAMLTPQVIAEIVE